MSTAYKTVISALDAYHALTARIPVFSPTGAISPFNGEKAAQVYAALERVRTECATYVENHQDDTLRTPPIQGIIDDIPAERRAIEAILSDPTKYPYALNDAIRRVREAQAEEARLQTIANSVVQMGSIAGNRQLNEVDTERQKKAKETNDKAQSEGSTERVTATPVARDVEGLKTAGLEAYESDMDALIGGKDGGVGRAPVAQDWRNNTATSKIGSVLGIKTGENYFRTVLMPALAPALGLKDQQAEVDPVKLTDQSKLGENVARMKGIYATLMRLFNAGGAANVPVALAQFCNQLHALALRKGMEAEEAYLLVSSQIFLRTINPMIINTVASVSEGQNGKRALMIVSKLFQDDANNVKHGVKEPFMKVFTDTYQEQITAFVHAVIEHGSSEEE